MVIKHWNEVKIGDIATVVGGGTPSSKVEEYWGGDIPWITPKDLSDHPFRYIKQGSRNITELGLEKSSAKLMPKGTLLISSRAPIGYTALAANEVCTNQGFKSLILKDGYHAEFFYYLINNNVHKLEAAASGTTFKEISGSVLKTIDFKVPPLLEQKAIAHILGTLDDKIELNRQMNETLEAMAQALFKSWFVDFDPVIDNALLAGKAIPEPLKERAELRQAQLDSGKAKTNSNINDLFPSEFEFTEELGWIPKGWDIKPLDEIADYLNGLALQKFRPQTLDEDFLPVLKIAQLRAGEPNYDERASLDIKPEYIVQDGDIIFSWSGSLLVDVWCGGKAALNQHLFKVTSESYPKWFYYCYTKHHLEEFQRIAAYKAVTMGHIKRSHLKEALCLVPDNLLEKKELYSLFEVILNRKIQNKTESKTLAKLRDTLLPNLMSGELRIADAEKLAENI